VKLPVHRLRRSCVIGGPLPDRYPRGGAVRGFAAGDAAL